MLDRSQAPVLQHEVGECGIACITYLLHCYGHDASIAEVRSSSSYSKRGMYLTEMISVLDRYGLDATPYKLEMDELATIRLPAVIHWNLDHYVVLEHVKRSSFVVMDPASGRRAVGKEEFSSCFTGIALQVEPTPEFRKCNRPRVNALLRFLRSVGGLPIALATVLALSICINMAVLASPVLMQWVIDQAIVGKDRGLLLAVVCGMAFLITFQMTAGLLRSVTAISLSAELSRQWTYQVFLRLMQRPLSFFETRTLGDIASRMSSLSTIQRAISSGFAESILDGVMAIAICLVMFAYSAKLALVTLAFVSAFVIVRQLSVAPIKQGTERQLVAGAKHSTHLLETLRTMQTIKIAGLERWRGLRYGRLLDEAARGDTKVAMTALAYGTVSQGALALERLVILLLGAGLVLDGVFSVGMLIAYLAYKDQFGTRVSAFVDKVVELRTMGVHFDRLNEMIDYSEDSASTEFSSELGGPIESIEFQGVTFRYDGSAAPVLKKCSFSLSGSERVALVGRSGVGKSTLVRVLLGINSPEEGKVLVNGRDLSTVDGRSYLDQIGSVMQGDAVFAGTIGENIALGDLAPNHERIEESARMACIHTDIDQMPLRYRTLVGDMGVGLSGGQRQRLLLARAIYRSPSFLVLDEATSELDVQSELLINAAISNLGLPSLVVAHRPETIRSCQRVLLLDGADIVEVARMSESHVPV